MKRFILKTILFLLPLLLLFVEVLLPVNIFTFRPWEALSYNSKKGMAFPFYPNHSLVMNSVGDLCYHTDNEITKYEDWITDELGFRNNTFIKKADVLFIGDSFIAGSGICQDSTITNQLSRQINAKVYNMAPSNFNEFVSLIDLGILDKPNLVVFGIVERTVPETLNPVVIEYNGFNANRFSILKDRSTRLYSFDYLKARLSNSKGSGIKGIVSGMYFFNGKDQIYNYDKVNEVANTISHYKKYCDSIGVDFIFLPLPNKETVYYQYVPLDKQPDYITELNSILNNKGVNTINTLQIYNDEQNDLLYHPDDTHWNANGVKLVVNELAKIYERRSTSLPPTSQGF